MQTLAKRLVSWASVLEDSTLEQARTGARMPGPTAPVPARREAV